MGRRVSLEPADYDYLRSSPSGINTKKASWQTLRRCETRGGQGLGRVELPLSGG